MQPDIRLRRTARDMVRRSSKAGMGPRTLAYVRLVLRDKRRSVLFATFPKSGWNWTVDVMTYTIVKTFIGRYDVTYTDDAPLKQREQKPMRLFYPADSRARGQKTIQAQFPQLPVEYLLHTHGAWKESPLWRLDRAKTICITRNIPTTLYSYYTYFKSIEPYDSFEACLDAGVLDRIIRFYNSWYRFQQAGGELHVFQYESMRRDPIEQFSNMYHTLFGQPVNEAALREALQYYSFDQQKRRERAFCADEKQHFHFRGATDYTDGIDPPTLEQLYARLERDLLSPFGYTYPATAKPEHE